MTKLIFFAIFFACSTLTNNPALAQTIIYGGTLIDLSGNGQNSQDIDNSYVIFEGNRIIETGIYTKQFVFPENAKRIDATGKYILPGLIDGFAALNNQSYANAYLYSGVTTIIAVDGGRRGAFFGDADPGPDYLRLESVGDDKKNDRGHLDDLEYLNEKGYEIALLKYELRPGQLKICNDEAHSLRMGTIGELGFTSYKEGCAIGIDAFVHTTRYSLDVAPEEMRLAVAQEPFSDDLNSSKWKYYQYLFNLDTSNKALKKHALVLAASDVFLMPTLSLLYLDLPDSKNPWLDPVSTILNKSDINNPADKSTGKHLYPEKIQENYSAMAIQEIKIEQQYKKAGCRYLAGSGTDVWGTMPGISLHTELELLSKTGLKNREAIAAASTNFSDAFGWKTGTIKKGYEADILIVNQNPIASLENLKDIHILINNGTLIDRDRMLLQGRDGTIIERKPFDLFSHKELMEKIAVMKNGKLSLLPEYKYLDSVTMEEIFYLSDGLKVKAYLAYPSNMEKYPAIIYNRGGNREFGALNPFKMAFILARTASWGYVVAGSQYRGNDGGEGKEEFGGKDVNDVLNLIPLLESLLNVDTGHMGMYGWSRGGMMTFLSLMQTNRIKAAVVGGAASDLQFMNDTRGGEMEKYVYSELIPNYEKYIDSLLAVRSAITQIDKICKTTPVLMLHGTADWRVVPEQSLNMAIAFQEKKIPYRLVMFEGGDHGLTEFNDEVDRMVKEWFDTYLKDGGKLPNLKPHGR